MVGADDERLARSRELVFGSSSSNKSSTEDDADVNKELRGLKMESSATTGTDDAALTVPSSRLGGGQTNEELGKKLVPSQHLPSPHRNHSQGSEQDEKKQQQGPEKVRHHQSQRVVHPFAANSSGPAAMDTDYEDEKTAAEAVHGMNMKTNTKADDEAYQSGKEVPRCDSENLDSSPDYGRREVIQGNSRHICKYCAKEFASGRALGGHMRAHGSLTVEEGPAWTTNTDGMEKQQLSGSMGHASHFFNNATDSGSDHALSNSVKQEGGPSYSKRSRNNGKEIQSGRSGGRRWKHSAKHREITPKNSEEEIDDIKQQHDDEEEEHNAAATMTEPEASMSSDDDGNNDDGANEEDGVTDGAPNVCNVCDREFESGKQLNSHKKSHGLYALRRNPKRSRRFIDQDYTAEAAGASVPAKKTSSMFTPDGNMQACTECGKRFQSWKALFGHMRCHPERHWRGIQRPDVPSNRQEGTSSAERQLTGSRRKEVVAPLPNAASQESDSESEALGASELTGHGKAAEAAAGAPASDNESDTESIEAAYMNGDRQPSTSTWIWMTGKRSKRSRQTVRSLQAVTKTAAIPAITPAENEMEHETAMGLMMLARKEGGKESWLEGRRSCEMELRPKEIHENASSETEGEELDEQLDNENAGHSDEDELAQKEDLLMHSKGKAKLEAADNASLCEENEDGADDCEAGEQGAASAKPKYVCNTCKRVFKSHQALGGHRASHKKVKGCFARTNVSDGVQENPDEEMMSEEFPRSDDQLPTELQDLSQSEGDEKERQFSAAYSKEDSGEIMNNGSRSKSKGHGCTICGRVFNSGQALGGHKRCHYNTKEGTSSEATSSTNNTNKQPAAAAQHHGGGGQGKMYKDELVQQGGPPARMLEETKQVQHGRSAGGDSTQPASQVRPMKEKFLDLNLPAPVNDDDMELEAYDMPPPDLMCVPLPKKVELKGAVGFPSAIGIAKSSSNFDAAELETGKPKEEYFPLYHTGKYASLVEENSQDLGGGQDTGFRGGEVDFSLRYVRCNICDRQFNTVEALSNHEKTHACMMSSVSGLTPISA